MQNLWFASRGYGVSMLAVDKTYGSDSSVVHYLHNDLDTNSIGHNYSWRFLQEDEKSLWVINWSGVDLFRNGRFEHVFDVEKPRSLLKLSEDTILIGTYNNGIYEAVKIRGRYIINKTPILLKYRALSMTTDNAGRLWMTDHLRNQLVCIDRQDNIAIEFNANDNLPASIGFISRTSKGVIVFASGAGFTLFDPLSLKINRAKTYPVLTQLKVNNEIPSIGENSKEIFGIKNDISVLDELLLDYQHNNFAIEFSAMEMTSPDKNLYRHKLEGYDKEWIETDWKERTATYTNLDAGHYVFRVRASNHHGIWSDQETILAVRILPPPWQTWWAYTLYGLAFITMVLYWRNYDIKRVKLKHRAEHLSELDDLKSRFFANISHEFRTPITLILGPLKDLYNGTAKEDPKTVIGAVLRNGSRLLRLINQLLDLSKIEAGKMQLHAACIDLVEFLREIASSYESLATDKKIKYFFYPEVPELVVFIDREKIEKVVHNLLSNAFKFTIEGGEVILNLKDEKDQCIITVKDTGIGIPVDQVDKVFDRFYQVDSSQTCGYEGSGLGMALARELVDLHKGRISVESKEGKGTTFTVSLPLGKERLSKEEITNSGFKKSEILSDVVISEETRMEIRNENETVSIDSQHVLLIVEDNADMRHYIRKTLAGQYQIIEAENGKQGVNKAEEIVPDLIISDIMMPEMDGYKLCEIIKTNELTSHIPVILLTAKADRESKLSGLEIGADDYLSKPFDSEELKLIVRNRIEERRKMRERFTREVTLEPKHISITSLDEKFLTKVLAIIETHMDNENFSIDELSREAAYSNMHFYRKIKALAGQTPSQFLRTIRLKRAAELLSKNSDNVTQIAYSVGFSSLSYFNKCFKEQFGVTPGQFAESNKAKP
ncbi:MAG: ATP-binding protein [Cyclobacteriaceae bacterium]